MTAETEYLMGQVAELKKRIDYIETLVMRQGKGLNELYGEMKDE